MSAGWWDGVLVGAAIGSAIAVVTVHHEVRGLVRAVEAEKATGARIESEWRRLEVARAAAERPERLKAVAARMGLAPPAVARIRRWEEQKP
ncbi:cell division protein FtsL [Hydrogenophilus thiooxidans]|uniref:cell division protein FtsL n=1 Tax=Hydrogenophilus thiooxidans TaxID=2820326 RepID=UPI001C232D92|nr:cell division protein FtsL [Hydrogenophilus thiooxidans]